MAIKILASPVAKSKRVFLKSLGAALAGASAVALLPAPVSAALSGSVIAEAAASQERGRRIGEPRPRAKLTEHEIDLLAEMFESGMSGEEMAARIAA